jgi:formylglycine-generating enzyme required for sulfatase activity
MKHRFTHFAILALLLIVTSGCGVGLCVNGWCTIGVSSLNLTAKWQRLDASWGATRASGYLLVRNAGSAVSWSPIQGQTYTAGQTVGATHVVVLSGVWTTASDTSLTNGATYHYQIFSHNSAYQYIAGATAAGIPGITCPTNYLAVGPNTDVLVSEAFCVSKYEMKILGDDNGSQAYSAAFVADSRASGTPWVMIDRNQAITECQALGAGYDLISNAQWQALAREIELAQSAGVFLNWSNGSTSGANALNRGHSDNGPSNALAASLDSDPCFGTGQASCANNTNADFTQKRTHTLSSGEVIWDVAGNVYEWVKNDIAPGPPYEGNVVTGNNHISQQPWTTGLNRPEMWGPFGNYTAKNSGEYGGLGYGNLGYSAGAVFRGGVWADGNVSGVFSAHLDGGPLDSVTNIGFRCVWATP